jgi:hypothetical protein
MNNQELRSLHVIADTPENVAACEPSHTGHFQKPVLYPQQVQEMILA